jgi:Cu-Zn family superoxide dismutase
MGSHFSPEEHEHALPHEAGTKHLGDLGNVVVDDKGDGRVEIVVPGATLVPNDAKSFLGRALVFHLNEDTGKKHQPSGDSGDPIACGVIEST